MHLPKSSWQRWGIFFGAGLLLFVAVSSQFRSDALTPAFDPLPQDPYIQVYFNQNQASVYTDPYRQINRYGDDLEQVIVDSINQAQTSIDIAVHELNLPHIAAALRDRAEAGVAIRVILENSYSTPLKDRNLTVLSDLDDYQQGKLTDLIALVDHNHDGALSQDELAKGDALAILDQAHISRLDDTADGSKGSGLMHHKFMVVDQRLVITGSTNWTLSGIHGDFTQPDSRGNANGLLVINNRSLAQVFATEFALMWGDGPDGAEDSQFGLQKPYRAAQLVSVPGSTVEVQFSPTSKTQPWSTSVNGLIDKTLGQATQSIDMALFVFSEQTLANDLFQVRQRGVSIKALIDPDFAYRSYSEGLDLLGLTLANHQCHYEARNYPWPQPIATVGIPQLPEGDKLHHKFAVMDGQTVIIGSQNWSQAANETNDENLLVIRNPTVAAHFQREFDRLYATAEVGITPKLQQTIASRRQKCGK